MKRLFFLGLLVISVASVYAQPSGTIMAFAGPHTKVPAGWVVCDGKLYNRSEAKYKALFEAIGVSWGGDGANRFAVPDLRGVFLRGVNETASADPDADKREKSRPDLNSSGNGGNAVGSKQSDAFGSHSHNASVSGGEFPFKQSGMGITANKGTEVQFRTLSVSVAPAGGKETRPKNAYVYYIIKL